MRMTALRVLTALPAAHGAQTFGVSLKGQGFYCGHEATVFSRPCSAEETPCAMQHFWSGGFFPEYGSSLLRYYVDGETTPSVVLPLALAHGQAPVMDDNAPWSAGSLMGKSGVGYAGWGMAHAAAERRLRRTEAGQEVRRSAAPVGSAGSGLFNSYRARRFLESQCDCCASCAQMWTTRPRLPTRPRVAQSCRSDAM